MHKFAKYCLLSAVLGLLPLCSAQAALDLYSAAVSVPDQGSSARAEGLQAALTQVVVRVSGDPDAALSSAGRSVAMQARSLVQQFGYQRVPQKGEQEQPHNSSAQEQPGDAAPNQSPPTDLQLQVSFNSRAVNSALRQAGLPVWGSERPTTMLWLARTGAGAPRLINGDEAAPLQQAADARGVPIVLPSQGAQERKQANAADVIAGYDDRLRAVARTHGAKHLLVAKIGNSGGLWQGRWSLTHSGETLGRWQDSASSEAQLLTDAMGRMADIYAQRYAVSSNAPKSTVLVAVDDVSTASNFARLDAYLSGLTAVDSAVPVLVNPDYVVFSVQLSGDVDVLRRNLGLADWLSADAAATSLAGVYDADATALGYSISRRR